MAPQYDHEGVIVGFKSKVVRLPASNVVFALRGGDWPRMPLEYALQFFSSFDQIIDGLPQLMRAMLAEYDAQAPNAHPADRHFEVTVAGWSDKLGRMVAGVVLTFDPWDPNDSTGVSHLDGYRSCVPWLPVHTYSAPPQDFEAIIGRPIITQADIDALDPERAGLAVHTAQRVEGGVYCGRAAYLVGGFAELTSVRLSGIESRVIHEWPDAVGETIKPVGGVPLECIQAVIDAEQAKNEAIQAYQAACVLAQLEPHQSGAPEVKHVA